MHQPHGTLQLPPQLSTLAPEVDWLYYFIYWVSVVLFLGIVGTMIYFVVKYRRRPGVSAEPTGHHSKLELFWTFTPLVLLVLLFHWGFQTYIEGVVAPADSREVQVRAMQWAWSFEHANGVPETGELTVPVNEPVRAVISSEDVLHSFFIPDFRVKRDAVPGMYTTLWFEATQLTHLYEIDPAQRCRLVPKSCEDLATGCEEGRFCVPSPANAEVGVCASRVACDGAGDCPEEYLCNAGACERPIRIFCAEYCGAPEGATGNAGHSAMLGAIHVVPSAEFERLLCEGPPMPPECEGEPNPAACWGRSLYEQNCQSCHHVDGVTTAPAPNLAGLWGTTEELAGGETVVVDENYIRESILQPQARITAGYEAVVMPPFRLSDAQIDALIAFIRSLEGEG